jgi:hypothetical protein
MTHMPVWVGQKLPVRRVGSQTPSERLIAGMFALGQCYLMRVHLRQKESLGFPSPPAPAPPTLLVLASPLVHPMSVEIVPCTHLEARVGDALFFFPYRQGHSTLVRVMPLERQLASL